ncbi:MAG: hypothetical protein HY776_05425 [Actinobacteria bacterium]|nr:hypothetical protein [Actinomycetota bacterium]
MRFKIFMLFLVVALLSLLSFSTSAFAENGGRYYPKEWEGGGHSDENPSASILTKAKIEGLGNRPEILYNWAGDDEDGLTDGVQIYPLASGLKKVWNYVVVKDIDNDVTMVKAILYNIPENPINQDQRLAEIWKIKFDNTRRDFQDYAILQGRKANIITAAQATEIRSLLDNNQAELYAGSWSDMDYRFPPGEYKWTDIAYDKGGNSAKKDKLFTWMEAKVLELDFEEIDFGTLISGGTSYVDGDDIMILRDGRPTLKNEGNVPLKLKVKTTDLVGRETGEKITGPKAFDVKFRAADYVKYDANVWFELANPLLVATDGRNVPISFANLNCKF